MLNIFTKKLGMSLLTTISKQNFTTKYIASIDQSTTSTKFSIF